jgi:hypothetical protein
MYICRPAACLLCQHLPLHITGAANHRRQSDAVAYKRGPSLVTPAPQTHLVAVPTHSALTLTRNKHSTQLRDSLAPGNKPGTPAAYASVLALRTCTSCFSTSRRMQLAAVLTKATPTAAYVSVFALRTCVVASAEARECCWLHQRRTAGQAPCCRLGVCLRAAHLQQLPQHKQENAAGCVSTS